MKRIVQDRKQTPDTSKLSKIQLLKKKKKKKIEMIRIKLNNRFNIIQTKKL